MKNSKKKAFSLAEIIISMTLIILVTGSGIMASNVALSARKNREQKINMWAMSESIYNAVISARDERLSNQLQDKNEEFFYCLNKKLSFLFFVKDFSSQFRNNFPKYQENVSWTISANKEQVSFVASLNENKLQGYPHLTIIHDHEKVRGNPNAYTYKFEQKKYKLIFSLNISSNICYYSIDGFYYNSDNQVYSYEEKILL